MRVVGYLESSFWMMRGLEFGTMMRRAYAHADHLDSILAKGDADGFTFKPDAMLAKKGERLAGSRYTEVRDGVAVIDVNGIVAKRMNLFDEVCFGGTSTEMLLKDLKLAVESPNVESIVLHIDSPGGEAFGVNELAQAVYDARGRKPVKAYISGLGCSGAYWIASAADEVIADKSAFLGSIGVVTAWMDDKKFYEMMGMRREVVTSSNAPFKRLDFDNEEHRAELQRELDSLEKIFHKAVARNRKVSVEQVISDFNQGGVLTGQEAVKAKMADRTGSLEEVIKELQNKKTRTATANARAEGDFDMGFKEEFKAFAGRLGFNVSEEESTKPADTPQEKPADDTAENPAPPAADPATEPEKGDVPNGEEKPSNAEATAQLADMRTKLAATEAAAFVDSEIKAGRLTPAEKDTFASLYAQAAADDHANPLASGSRVESLKAIQSKRVSHGFDTEKVDAENNKVLVAAIGGDSSTEDRSEKLLQMTPVGKRGLEIIQGGKK